VKKRPNPAVEASARNAAIAEDMAKLAEATMPKTNATPSALKALAERRRTVAKRIRKNNPFLISNE